MQPLKKTGSNRITLSRQVLLTPLSPTSRLSDCSPRRQEDLHRHRPVQPPGDGHRPTPLVGDVISRPKEHVRRGAQRVGLRLPHEEQDIGPALAVIDVALASR